MTDSRALLELGPVAVRGAGTSVPWLHLPTSTAQTLTPDEVDSTADASGLAVEGSGDAPSVFLSLQSVVTRGFNDATDGRYQKLLNHSKVS